MKAIEVSRFGPPEVLEIIDKEIPQLKDDEVLVEVKAIGVNPVETYIRAGTYPKLPELPYTPGENVSGVIIKCGPAVSSFQEGDRVYSWATLTGAYSEYVLCGEHQIFHLSEKLTFSQGAAIGVPAATAWRALFIRGKGRKNERLLVHGASGSVGQAAVQLALDAGMKVFGTGGTATGCKLLQSLGCEAVNHRSSDYIDSLKDKTDGKGFDLILEMLANENLENDLDLLSNKGRVVVIGSRGRIEIDPRATMAKESSIMGLALMSSSEEEVVQTHKGIALAIDQGGLLPRVSSEIVLADAPRAHRQVMENGNCGKIVLLP